MVALAVPRFGFQPTLCLARPMLLQALERYEQGDYVGSAVRLREAVKRFLVAAVAWYDVPVAVAKHPRPMDLAKALRNAKQLDKWGFECIEEMIETGNRGAHLGRVERDSLRGGIAILFSLMDGEPYTMPELRGEMWVKPDEQNIYDIDDCDDDRSAADWWKPEDWNPEGGES